MRSAQYLADHFEDVPLFLFAFVAYDPTGGSIYPAVWSAMLAARAQGVGSSLTTVLGFFHAARRSRSSACPTARAGSGLLRVVRVPDRPVGRGAPAGRCTRCRSATAGATPLGFEVPEPLWSPSDA